MSLKVIKLTGRSDSIYIKKKAVNSMPIFTFKKIMQKINGI